LIDQARTQLWKIVNEFIDVKKNGRKPELQVALYEYGNNWQPVAKGYIRQVLPLTTDLDKVSQELFALKTNGGSEYCGQVIQEAAKDLKWSKSTEDLKVIFIAGNEPFTQGTVDYRKAVPEAIAKGIVVNTIHCGSEQEGINGHWKDGAVLADGAYIHIDHNSAVVYVEAPQDKRIAELGAKLNKTYIAFGSRGREGLANQAAQDSNAGNSSRGSFINRMIFRSSSQYNNSEWDLVDALDAGSIKLDDIKKEDLPENMQKMTKAEQTAYLNAKMAERKQLQTEIASLNAERKIYIADKMKEQTGSAKDTLDTAMSKVLHSMMARKKFTSE